MKDNEKKLLCEAFIICLGCLHTVFQESSFQSSTMVDAGNKMAYPSTFQNHLTLCLGLG